LTLALLLIAYGTSDNAGIQEGLEESSSLKKGLQLAEARVT